MMRLENAKRSDGEGRKLLSMLAALLISVGMTGSFSALGGFPLFGLPFFGCGAALLAFFLLERLFPQKEYGFFVCLMAAFGLFLFRLAGSVRGIYAWIDGFQSAWNASFGTYFEGFGVQAVSVGDMITVGLVASFLLTLIVCRLLGKGKRLALTAVCIIFLIAGILLTPAMPVWIGALLFGGWLLFWMGTCSGFEPRVLSLSGLLAVVMVLLLVVEPWGGSWNRTGLRFRENFRGGVERLRYGSDTLPEGDLRRAQTMNDDDGQVRLQVKMSYPDALYLRGFVGSELEENLWRAPEASAYRGDYRGMMDWLKEQGFSPAFQYGN